MIILLEIALVLLLVGLGVRYLLRGRQGLERQETTERRVEAYMQTIRRENRNPELSAMTDTELRDVLASAARNLKVQSDRKFYILVGGLVIAVVAAIAVGTEDGTRGFAVALLIGALVLYGTNEFLTRRMRQPLIDKGIDVERLRVE